MQQVHMRLHARLVLLPSALTARERAHLARVKQYRAIATRYDKTAATFLGAIHLAASVAWLI